MEKEMVSLLLYFALIEGVPQWRVFRRLRKRRIPRIGYLTYSYRRRPHSKRLRVYLAEGACAAGRSLLPPHPTL